MGMLEIFYPDETADTSYGIDYEALYRKGYRGLIYDVDNTLVPHAAASVLWIIGESVCSTGFPIRPHSLVLPPISTAPTVSFSSILFQFLYCISFRLFCR